MSKRLSYLVRFFIDKNNFKNGRIVDFSEVSKNDLGVLYHIITDTDQVIDFYLPFFYLLKDTPDKLFIGKGWVTEAIASDFNIGYVLNEVFYKSVEKINGI
jgi:hypothetical protein